MDEQAEKRIWENIKSAESDDLAEIAATIATLDRTSAVLVEYINKYGSITSDKARRNYLKVLRNTYADSFSRFANAVARDPYLNDAGRWTTIKAVMANEEAIRMGAIAANIDNVEVTFTDVDARDTDELIERLYGNAAFDQTMAEKVTDTFTKTTQVDLELFKAMTRKDKRL